MAIFTWVDLLPIVGVVVGGVMTWGATALTDRSRARQARAERWDERRLQAYGEYATAVKDETRLCFRMATHLGLGNSTDPLDPAVGLPRLAETEDRALSLFESILLLGDSTTIAAARRWQQLVWELHGAVDGSSPGSAQSFMDSFRQAGGARDEFH
jgi:hypothetical protein